MFFSRALLVDITSFPFLCVFLFVLEAAIALSQSDAKVLISDSQQALRNFANGRQHVTTLRLINQRPPTNPVRILWAPAHSGIPSNEIADFVARDFTRRASADKAEAEPERMQPLRTLQKISQHYRVSRKTLSSPHKSLPRYPGKITACPAGQRLPTSHWTSPL